MIGGVLFAFTFNVQSLFGEKVEKVGSVGNKPFHMASILAPLAPAMEAFVQILTPIQAILVAELKSQRKYWRQCLPTGKHGADLFGAAAAPAYSVLVLIVGAAMLFYVKVTCLARSLHVLVRASYSTLGTARDVWALTSSLLGLLAFVYDVYKNGGGARFFQGVSMGGGSSPKPLRLVWSWALSWNCLAMDAGLTLLSCAPLLLRVAANLRPAIWETVYPLFPRPKKTGEGKEAADARPPTAATGTTAEVLRSLDCWDLLLARMGELSILYFMHRFQS